MRIELACGVWLYLGQIKEGAGRSEAVGELLAEALGSAEYRHNPDGVPFVEGFDGSISISHSRHVAALAVSAVRTVGVDVEEPRANGQLERIAPRVLSPVEMETYAGAALLLKAWTLKEALYKAALVRGLDFRAAIQLPPVATGREAVANGRRFDIIYSRECAIWPEAWVSVVVEANK